MLIGFWLQIAHGANVCKPWEAGAGVRRRPGCRDHLGVSKVTALRHLVYFVGSGWQDGTMRGGGGEQGQHLWQKVKEKTWACPSFISCQAPPEAWAPPQPLHHTGCPESLSFFQGSWQGGQAAQRFAASPSAEAPGCSQEGI